MTRLILVIALLAYIASVHPQDAAAKECANGEATDTCVGCTDDCLTGAEPNPRLLPSET